MHGYRSTMFCLMATGLVLLSTLGSRSALGQATTPVDSSTQGSQAAPTVDATHRTEPLEPDISDREKRELEIRAQQTIGKTLVSPDGKFFIYEWRRPYDWDKDFGQLPPNVAGHQQSWLYFVEPEISATDSKYLFLYESGASMWLGSISPDSSRVSFYDLDNDNKLKTGVWDFVKSKITWFSPAPDEKRLDVAPVWASNRELIYPGHGGTLVRASVLTEHASICADCKEIFAKGKARNQAAALKRTPRDLGPDMKLLAESKTGELAVYERSNSDRLALLFKKGTEKEEMVFENSRLGSGPPPVEKAKPEN
jgi:hypothetical protein